MDDKCLAKRRRRTATNDANHQLPCVGLSPLACRWRMVDVRSRLPAEEVLVDVDFDRFLYRGAHASQQIVHSRLGNRLAGKHDTFRHMSRIDHFDGVAAARVVVEDPGSDDDVRIGMNYEVRER